MPRIERFSFSFCLFVWKLHTAAMYEENDFIATNRISSICFLQCNLSNLSFAFKVLYRKSSLRTTKIIHLLYARASENEGTKPGRVANFGHLFHPCLRSLKCTQVQFHIKKKVPCLTACPMQIYRKKYIHKTYGAIRWMDFWKEQIKCENRENKLGK